MYELDLWTAEETNGVVNVASVPQRSPFRYPGGKTWLVPHIRRWLRSLDRPSRLLIEPFAGGGIISLTAAFESLADRVVMVELDEDVASVWRTILSDDGEWLANKVITFDLTPQTVADELLRTATETRERAFQVILRNRVLHGGILAPGSGLIKNGENGRGLSSRWYPSTLRKRILSIWGIRKRITFIEGDGMDVLRSHTGDSDAVFFIDPPYTAGGKRAGRRLYKYNELDHGELFRIASTLAGSFLMTYDDAQEVRSLASQHHFDTEMIPMTNTHHAVMTELLISRDLGWAR